MFNLIKNLHAAKETREVWESSTYVTEVVLHNLFRVARETFRDDLPAISDADKKAIITKTIESYIPDCKSLSDKINNY
jgi:hypothetical protein